MIIVGIAGGSASGKTRVAKMIASHFSDDICILKYDSYYLSFSEYSLEERKTFNYDHPDTFDHELLKNHLKLFLEGKTVATPIYDYINYERSNEVFEVKNPTVLIIEGILALYDEEIRNMFDIKVFIDTDDDIRFIRRLKRDIEKRGRDFESVSSQYLTTVKHMHDLYIQPTKRYADIVVPLGADNTVAIEMICSYIKCKKSSLVNDF